MIQHIKNLGLKFLNETTLLASGLNVDVISAYMYITLEHGLSILHYVLW